MPDSYLNITGWLSVAEGHALRTLAAGRTVLELGSWHGRSTVCIAEVATRVVSVDGHTGDRHTGAADTLASFTTNLKNFGVDGRVEVIVGDIAEVGPTLPAAAFDLIFVDSAHDAASAERDARIALRCVRPGGTIAFHDCHYPSVIAGLARTGIDVTRPDGRADSLAWIHVPGPTPEPA